MFNKVLYIIVFIAVFIIVLPIVTPDNQEYEVYNIHWIGEEQQLLITYLEFNDIINESTIQQVNSKHSTIKINAHFDNTNSSFYIKPKLTSFDNKFNLKELTYKPHYELEVWYNKDVESMMSNSKEYIFIGELNMTSNKFEYTNDTQSSNVWEAV